MKTAVVRTRNESELRALYGLFSAALLEAKREGEAQATGSLRRRTFVRELEPGIAVALAIRWPDRKAAASAATT